MSELLIVARSSFGNKSTKAVVAATMPRRKHVRNENFNLITDHSQTRGPRQHQPLSCRHKPHVSCGRTSARPSSDRCPSEYSARQLYRSDNVFALRLQL